MLLTPQNNLLLPGVTTGRSTFFLGCANNRDLGNRLSLRAITISTRSAQYCSMSWSFSVWFSTQWL